MATERQLAANAANAQKSTGPRTAEGKAASGRNARTHGLSARELVLPDEKRDEFESLAASLCADLQPEGELESLLAEQVVHCFWKLRRARRIETGVLSHKLLSLYKERSADEPSAYGVTNVPLWKAAIAGLQEQVPTLGETYCDLARYGDAHCKISRHIGDIERSLYRALHELQRAQAKRLGEAVPAPMVAEVDVAIS